MDNYKYNCLFCKYTTNSSQSWYQHTKAKKHLKNVKITEQNNDTSEKSIDTSEKSIDTSQIIKTINQGNTIKFLCNYCQTPFTKKSNLYRHRKDCKKKFIIVKSGLYCMWNYKMIDEEGNSYYKLGRTSSRDSRISSYANEYGVTKSDIKFIYEVEFKDEVFAEKFLFYLLQEYRIYKIKELFKVNLDTIKDTMNQLKIILENTHIIHNPSMILDNFDNIMNENMENIDDEVEKENKKYLISILNGDYDLVENLKQLDDKLKPYICKFCKKSFTRYDNLERHLSKRCKEKKKLEEEEKKKLEEEKNKQEDEKQKFMIQFMEKQAEERRIEKEEQRKLMEEQRKRDEQQAEEQRKRDKQQSKLMEMILLSQNNKEGISLNIEDMYEKIEKMIDKKLQGGESKTDNSENYNKHCLDLQLTSEYKLEYRHEDGYINVTGLCQATNKKISNWFQLDKTKAFIEVLSTNAGIPASKLIYKGKGGKKKSQSWVHPQIAVNIAQWISPKFDVLVSKWVYEIMATGVVHVYNTKPYKELEELNKMNIKRIKELESKYLKKQKSKNY